MHRKRAELLDNLNQRGIRVYPLKRELRNLPRPETRAAPANAADDGVVKMVAAQLDVPQKQMDDAVRVARNQLREIERHTG